MCLRSLMFHTRYFFKAQYKRKFIIGDHHTIIAQALEKVLTGEITRLLIAVSPRYGKTELAVKSFISNGLALNAAAKFIHLSYADALALDNSESIKDLVQSHEYQTLFPEVQIKKDSKAKDKWYTTAGGGVLARAAAGQVTGFGAGHVDEETPDEDDPDFDEFMAALEQANGSALEKKFQFSGAIIIDDPIKPEDADSETVRNKVNSRFDSTIRNRVNSRRTPIIVIMQRLDPEDLIGYLLRDNEQDDWTLISLACLTMDKDGNKKALWPHKETVEELEKQRLANEIVFERQKQQNPKPKAGLLFPQDDLHYYDPGTMNLLDPDFTFVPCDPANEGGDDFAAGDFRLVGDMIYLRDVLYNTDGADFNEVALVNLVKAAQANSVGVESTFGWKETAERVRSDLENKGFEGEFRMLRPRQQKHSRILNRASFIRNHIVFRSDWRDLPQYAKFMRNLTSYLRIQEAGKGNKHDDAPDLCEMAGSYFEKNFAHLFGMNKK